MHQIEEEIERLSLVTNNQNDNESKENNVSEGEQQLAQLGEQLSQLNQEIFHLSRKIDSRPTQIELNQYQRRFVELYNQGRFFFDE
jgi:predicted  nucleic acid-binding Zn-ribbon protein